MENNQTDKINYVCSLGNNCHSANILKRNGLKICSYPFDWIFSNYGMIKHCIQDDFNTFLSKSQYNSISKTSCEHIFYKQNYGLGPIPMFRHFNPSSNKRDYSYYKRCVKRFRFVLNSLEPKLFVIMINMNDNQYDMQNATNQKKLESKEFDNFLSTYTTNYKLFVIFNVTDQNEIHHNLTCDLNINYLELYTKSSSAEKGFANEEDNIYLDNIISQIYSFDLKNILI